LPLVYDELRKLAAARLIHEWPGQTLQATALVHEAYLRLVKGEDHSTWDSRGHFFVAAAEAMRRILIEQARRKGRLKHGADFTRHDVDNLLIAPTVRPDEILAVHDALTKLEATNDKAAQLVKLRFFAGLTIRETALALGVSTRKADQIWAYARVWLLAEMGKDAS
jgi:RNA polymerase sigma factor (TIGR02999 family)